MQKLFLDTRKLDSSCCFAYGLTEEIMMENAASALESQIRLHADCGSKIIILCGGGNNGADGYALARRIRLDYEVKLYKCYEPKSQCCITQAERAEKCGVPLLDVKRFPLGDLRNGAVVVDCIFGSGFRGELEGESAEQIISTLNDVNASSCYRIACDVPTGLRQDGTVCDYTFAADLTVTMGALKMCLYSDKAKDFTGEIVCANLGISRSLFENSNKENLESAYLLEKEDMVLPFRRKNFVNKGSFGSAWIASGEKVGAGCLAARACLKFGAGLVTLIRPELSFSKADLIDLSVEILTAFEFGERVDCVAAGMGLGHNEREAKYYFDYLRKHKNVSCVLDADLCYSPQIKVFLAERGEGCVLTPHPKEFSALLSVCGLGSYPVEECVNKRAELIEKFCRAFPGVVLLVKGSNPMIGVYNAEKGFKLYINRFGRPSLAKAGSGDVLSGMITALLVQGYSTIEAAISGSLAHAFASHCFKNDFSLTPTSLIEAVGQLE